MREWHCTKCSDEAGVKKAHGYGSCVVMHESEPEVCPVRVGEGVRPEWVEEKQGVGCWMATRLLRAARGLVE